MSVPTLLVVLLLIFLIGGAVPWGYPGNPQQPGQPPGYFHGYGYGPYVPGIGGVIVLILVVLLLAGRI